MSQFGFIQELLYPIGFVSTFLFGIRFLVQWVASEKVGAVAVPPLFWHLSWVGNLFLAIHGALQLQLPIAVVQSIQGVLALRNLELQGVKTPSRLPMKVRLGLTFFTVVSLFSFFCYLRGEWEWMRIPSSPWWKSPSLPHTTKLVGGLGIFLFSSRFFVQWWQAEKLGKSQLTPLFWTISLIGALLSSFYFWYSLDLVNLLGPLLGSLGSLRNLFLAKKSSREQTKL